MLLLRFLVLSDPPTQALEVAMFKVEEFAPKMLTPPLDSESLLVDFYSCARIIRQITIIVIALNNYDMFVRNFTHHQQASHQNSPFHRQNYPTILHQYHTANKLYPFLQKTGNIDTVLFETIDLTQHDSLL